MQVVHVIPPPRAGGQRHEEVFEDTISEDDILAIIDLRAARYGVLQIGSKAVYYLDHPDTVVALGTCEGGQFTETRRLRGPS